MIPKGGYGADSSGPFGLFRKAAEFFAQAKEQPRQRVRKVGAEQELLYEEKVAPGVSVAVPGITKSGGLLETDAERLYDFDVFDVWSVDGDKLVLATEDREDTLASNGVREWNAVVASRFGTELYPLLMDLVMLRGPITREEAVEYLQNIGEPEWANYILSEIGEDQWADILGSLSDIGPDELLNTASRKTAEVTECFRKGYEYGSSPGAVELTSRQIEEVYPDVDVDEFAQGMLDGLQRDTFRLDLQSGQGDMFRGLEDERLAYQGTGQWITMPEPDMSEPKPKAEAPKIDKPKTPPSQPTSATPAKTPAKTKNKEEDKSKKDNPFGTAKKDDKEQGKGEDKKPDKKEKDEESAKEAAWLSAAKWADLDVWEGEQEEPDQDQPQPEDIVMYSSGPLGSKTSVGEAEGKFLGEFDTEQEAEVYIKQYMQQQNFYPTVWYQDDHGGFTLRTLTASKTAAGSEDETAILRNFFISGDPELRGTRPYVESIIQYTGCTPEEAGAVEWLMRGDRPTLDALSPEQFRQLAVSTYDDYKYVMGKTGSRKTSATPLEGHSPNEQIAEEFYEMHELNRIPPEYGTGSAQEMLRLFVEAEYPEKVAEYEEILRIFLGIMDVTDKWFGGKQAVRKKAVSIEDAPYDESKPWGGKPSRHVNYTEFGISDEDDIPEAWLMGATNRGQDVNEAVKEWFHQKWLQEGRITFASVDNEELRRVAQEFLDDHGGVESDTFHPYSIDVEAVGKWLRQRYPDRPDLLEEAHAIAFLLQSDEPGSARFLNE